MPDVLSLRTAGRRIDLGTSFREAVTITNADYGNPEQRPTLADGSEGGVPIGPSEWETSRSVEVDVDCESGNVPGDVNGLAINRLSGRDPVAAVGGVVTWTPDLTDYPNTSPADFAVQVRPTGSSAVAVYIEVKRGATTIGSPTQTICPAGKWTQLVYPNAPFGTAGAGALTIRVVSNPGGQAFTTRNPVYGQGLGGGIYHDRFTPGATNPLLVNPVNNPKFSSSATGWTHDVSAGLTLGLTGRQQLSDGSGDYGYRLAGTNTTAATRNFGIVMATPYGDWVPVKPGELWTISADFLNVTGFATHFLQFNWHDAAGASVSFAAGPIPAIASGTRTRLTLGSTAPAGAAFLRITAYFQATAAVPVNGYITRIMASSVGASTFFDGDSPDGVWLGVPNNSASTYPSGRAERPANGEAWATAFLGGIGEACGSVAPDLTPTLVRTGDSWAGSLTFEVQRAGHTPEQNQEHSLGYGKTKLQVTAKPLVLGSPRTLPGAMRLINGLPIWTASTTTPGDAPALATITASWGTGRRDTRAVATSGGPYALLLTKTIASWSYNASGGATSSTPLAGSVPETRPAVVASAISATTGPALVDLRCAPYGVKTLRLLVNGNEAARVNNIPVAVGFLGPWRLVNFGVVQLKAGDRLQIQAGGEGSGVLHLDYLGIYPGEDVRSAYLLGQARVVGDLVWGDDFPSGSGSINGRTASLGGTWVASASPAVNWNVTAGTGAVSQSASGYAALGSFGVLGYGVDYVQTEFRVSPIYGQAFDFGLSESWSSSGPGGRSVWISFARESAPVLNISQPSQVTTQVPLALNQSYPFPPTFDFRIGVDGAGRITVDGAIAGRKLNPLFRGHAQGHAGGPVGEGALNTGANYSPGMRGGTAPGSIVRSIRNTSTSSLGSTTDFLGATSAWTASGPLTPAGDLPMLTAGRTAKVVMRAAGSDLDAPSNPNPTAVAVTVQPRYLQVPRG